MKSHILSLYIFLTLFLVVQESSFNDKRILFTLGNDLVGSKKGDTFKGLVQAKEYLIKYGYLSPFTMDSHQQSYDTNNERFDVLDHSVEEALKKFQHFYHLNVSGVLDEKTLSLMTRPRCSFPDFVNGKVVKHGTKLSLNSLNRSFYVTGRTKWSKLNLTWAIKPGTRVHAHQPIISAFRRWGLVTKFKFFESNNYKKSDVKISFFRRRHGDNSPFDGPRGVLAHAWMPPNGHLHFDADEKWVIGAVPGGVDIESVALHELGHILGLAHSNVKAAIMWPYIPIGAIKRLNIDDIVGIKTLYHFP